MVAALIVIALALAIRHADLVAGRGGFCSASGARSTTRPRPIPATPAAPGSRCSLVVDIQLDVHTKLVTRVVVPMTARARYTRSATRLTLTVQVRGSDYVPLFPLVAAIPSSALGEVVDSLVARRAILLN